MRTKEFFENLESHISALFTEKSPGENVYHDMTHTTEVVRGVAKIGKAAGLTEEELQLVTVAAWFHDVGYIEKEAGHEEVSARYARDSY